MSACRTYVSYMLMEKRICYCRVLKQRFIRDPTIAHKDSRLSNIDFYSDKIYEVDDEPVMTMYDKDKSKSYLVA